MPATGIPSMVVYAPRTPRSHLWEEMTYDVDVLDTKSYEISKHNKTFKTSDAAWGYANMLAKKLGVKAHTSGADFSKMHYKDGTTSRERYLAKHPVGGRGWHGESKRHSDVAIKTSDKRDSKIKAQNKREFGV